jgi:predicted kinase
MKNIYILFGPPLSGKSYFTRLITKNSDVKCVSRDQIRDTLNDHSQNPETEKIVTNIHDSMLLALVDQSDYDVIVDNTHYRLAYIKDVLKLLNKCKKDFLVKLVDFSHIDYQILLQRNEIRDRKVPVNVIKKIYETCKMNIKEAKTLILNFKKEKKQIMETLPIRFDLPRAIIVDIDGTLAHKGDRNPFDYKNVDKDAVDEVVMEIVNQFYGLNYHVIIVSGREDSCRDLTTKWLKDNMINYHYLHMRKSKDMRKDAIVKKEIYENLIKDHYSVLFVLDDRNQVVEMWREIGLKCLQVAEGDF